MTRCIAFILALVFASLSVSSACMAADLRPIHFAVAPEHAGGIARPLSMEAFGLMAVGASPGLVDIPSA